MSVKIKEITIELTRYCPLRCIFCSSNTTQDSNCIGHGLKHDDVKDIISQAIDLGANRINFSGGEPCAIWYLPEVVSYALSLKSDLDVRIYTSGVGDLRHGNTAYSRNGVPIHIVDIDSRALLVFNIPHYSETTANFLYGDRSFHITRESIEICKELNRPFAINTIYTRLFSTEFSIEDFIYVTKELQPKYINFMRLVLQGRAKENEWILKPKKEDVLFLSNFLDKNKNIGTTELKCSESFRENGICSAYTHKIVITNDSEVFGCEAFKGIEQLSLGGDISDIKHLVKCGRGHINILKNITRLTNEKCICPAQNFRGIGS